MVNKTIRNGRDARRRFFWGIVREKEQCRAGMSNLKPVRITWNFENFLKKRHTTCIICALCYVTVRKFHPATPFISKFQFFNVIESWWKEGLLMFAVAFENQSIFFICAYNLIWFSRNIETTFRLAKSVAISFPSCLEIRDKANFSSDLDLLTTIFHPRLVISRFLMCLELRCNQSMQKVM